MVTYPISVPHKQYQGSNQRRRDEVRRHNELAELLQQNINEKMRRGSEQMYEFTYREIALELQLTEEEVFDLLFAVDCGHNAITVIKSPK